MSPWKGGNQKGHVVPEKDTTPFLTGLYASLEYWNGAAQKMNYQFISLIPTMQLPQISSSVSTAD